MVTVEITLLQIISGAKAGNKQTAIMAAKEIFPFINGNALEHLIKFIETGSVSDAEKAYKAFAEESRNKNS